MARESQFHKIYLHCMLRKTSTLYANDLYGHKHEHVQRGGHNSHANDPCRLSAIYQSGAGAATNVGKLSPIM